MPTTTLGEFTLVPLAEQRPRQGQTASKATSTGTSWMYRLEGMTLALEIGVTRWENGDREVACLSRLNSPEPLDRLTHGMRLGFDLDGVGRHKLRVRTPKLGNRDWPTLHLTSVDELDAVTGLDTEQVLTDAGALAFGTAERVLRSEVRSKRDLYVVFDDSDSRSEVPAVAYAIAVAMPMYLQFSGS